EASSLSLGEHVRELQRKPYLVYAAHILPHDAEAHELGTGKTRIDTLRGLGVWETRVLPCKQDIMEGINAARLLIPKCFWDGEKCERGLEALMLYRADVDRRFLDPATKLPLLKAKEVKDWTNHAADAFRYLAEGIDDRGFHSNFYKPIEYPRMGIV